MLEEGKVKESYMKALRVTTFRTSRLGKLLFHTPINGILTESYLSYPFIPGGV